MKDLKYFSHVSAIFYAMWGVCQYNHKNGGLLSEIEDSKNLLLAAKTLNKVKILLLKLQLSQL